MIKRSLGSLHKSLYHMSDEITVKRVVDGSRGELITARASLRKRKPDGPIFLRRFEVAGRSSTWKLHTFDSAFQSEDDGTERIGARGVQILRRARGN